MHRVPVNEARLADACARSRLRVSRSVARGTAPPKSSIDELHELEPGPRLGWGIEQLADELAVVVGRPVDLVSLPRSTGDSGRVISEARTL